MNNLNNLDGRKYVITYPIIMFYVKLEAGMRSDLGLNSGTNFKLIRVCQSASCALTKGSRTEFEISSAQLRYNDLYP